ncbi:MAG: Hpt domain-containing protein, partial [Pseudomonas sp.]|nr:Hpt domain-containing protein [Pseudomonas sp.]
GTNYGWRDQLMLKFKNPVWESRARKAADRTAMIERVHRLNGASRYCGVPQLRAACQRSETLLKQDSPHALQALDELDQAINRLAEQARQSA